jgi:hypothetical protein
VAGSVFGAEREFPKKMVTDVFWASEEIRKISRRHPNQGMKLGDWHDFGYLNGVIGEATGKEFYFVFPEAEGDPEIVIPSWHGARTRLLWLREEFSRIDPTEPPLDDASETGISEIAAFEHVTGISAQSMSNNKPRLKGNLSDFARKRHAEQVRSLDLMIETIDPILDQPAISEFLLNWSA